MHFSEEYVLYDKRQYVLSKATHWETSSMPTTIKITLSAPPDIVQMAKQIAAERNTSVSALFANYIRAIHQANHPVVKPKLHPAVEALTGIIKLPSDFNLKEFMTENLIKDYGITEDELQQMKTRLESNTPLW